MSRGTASGQSGSNRPRTAPGTVHRAWPSPRPAGTDVRQDRRRVEQHDPEILRDVARVLDRPVEVVAEVRVEARLELVEVLVAGVDQVPGRDQVVEEQRPDRDRRPDRRRQPAAPPRAAAADEQEERRAEDDRQPARAGEPEQEAGEELAAGRGRAGRAPPARPRTPAAAGADRDDARRRRRTAGRPRRSRRPGRAPSATPTEQQQQRDRQDVGLVPRRRRAGPSTRTPSRSAKKTVAADAHDAPDRQPAEHPPRAARRRPRRGSRRRAGCRSRGPRAPRTAGGAIAGSGGNGIVAARHAVARGDRQDVLEAGVAGARVDRPDRVADRGLALEEGQRLPHEVVVDAARLGDRVHEQGRQHEAQPDRHRDRRVPAPGTVGRRFRRRWAAGANREARKRPCATLRSTSARSSRRPSCVDRPRIGRAEPGRRRTDADQLDAGGRRRDPGRARPGARRSTHHRIRLPRDRLQVRRRLVPRLGREPRPERPVRRLRPAASSSTTRPATSTSCGWSGSSGRRPAASAT